MFGSKTAPRLPTGSFRTGTITPFTVIVRNGDFRPHLWGTHDQHLCLVCIQFQFILRHPCIDVGEAVFRILNCQVSQNNLAVANSPKVFVFVFFYLKNLPLVGFLVFIFTYASQCTNINLNIFQIAQKLNSAHVATFSGMWTTQEPSLVFCLLVTSYWHKFWRPLSCPSGLHYS